MSITVLSKSASFDKVFFYLFSVLVIPNIVQMLAKIASFLAIIRSTLLYKKYHLPAFTTGYQMTVLTYFQYPNSVLITGILPCNSDAAVNSTFQSRE